MKVKSESPVLFSTPMVEAILAGRKTQTRRVFKGIGKWSHESLREMQADPDKAWAGSGYPEKLWVKETFYAHADGSVIFKAGLPGQHPVPAWKPSIFMPRRFCRLTLEVAGVRLERLQDISADDALAEGVIKGDSCGDTTQFWVDSPGWCEFYSAREAYRVLWDEINAKRGFAWSRNPWVWVISFTVAERSDLCGA